MNFKILIAIIMFNCYVTIFSMHNMMDLNRQLSTAAKFNYITKVENFLDQGNDPNYANPNFKIHGIFTSLHDAVRKGNLIIVQTFLDHGANPNCKDSMNCTPLHDAAENGYSEIALALLRKGATINASDNFGRTPLHKAARKGHAGTIDVLFMKKGADVNAQDHFGKTPLLKAIEYSTPNSAIIVQKLLDKGADPDIKNPDGNTALHEAARFNKFTMLKALLVRRPDPFITNNEEKKASDVARDPLIKKMLQDYEADYRRQNLENLKIFSQELRKKRGYKSGDAYEVLTTEVSQYL